MTKIIKIYQYWLLVNNTFINKGKDWWIYPDNGNMGLAKEDLVEPYLKIIAHLPIGGAPKLEGVPELPEPPKQEDEYDRQFKEIEDIEGSYQSGWVDGYSTGRAASQGRMYSERECIDAVVRVLSQWKTSCINVKGEPNVEFLAEIEMTLQSLSPVQEDNMCDDHTWSGKGRCPYCEEVDKNFTPPIQEWEFEPEWEAVIDNIPIEKGQGKMTSHKELKIIKGIIQGKWIKK